MGGGCEKGQFCFSVDRSCGRRFEFFEFLKLLKLCTCAESGGCQRFFGAVSVFSKANCGHCFSFLKKEFRISFFFQVTP
jgi:hypothetical protein